MKKLLILALLLLPTVAYAQSQRNPCYGPSANSSSCIGVTTDTPLPVIGSSSIIGTVSTVSVSDYPSGANAIAATSGNVAASTATATLAGTANKTTYISSFTITGAGATSGSVINCSIGNLIGGVIWSIAVAVPTGATVGITPIIVNLTKAVPANGANTSISVTCPSFGAGNTNAAVTASGYQF